MLTFILPPFLCNSKGIQPLTDGTTLLGMFNDLPHIKVGEIYLEEESTLVLFTDGLTDLLNEQDEFFDVEGVELFCKNFYTLNPEDFNNKILERLNSFKGTRQNTDDVTILTCKLK